MTIPFEKQENFIVEYAGTYTCFGGLNIRMIWEIILYAVGASMDAVSETVRAVETVKPGVADDADATATGSGAADPDVITDAGTEIVADAGTEAEAVADAGTEIVADAGTEAKAVADASAG